MQARCLHPEKFANLTFPIHHSSLLLNNFSGMPQNVKKKKKQKRPKSRR
jgi:hypothetical protein